MEVSAESHVRANRSGVSPRIGTGLILALDAATDRAAVGLGLPDGSSLSAPLGESKRHGRGLVATIRTLLDTAGYRVQDLDAIGVGLGPGSFTGLRIGVTAAKTLAYATGCRLIGLDSLEILSRNAPREASRIAVAVDAQRGDVFAADFARTQDGSVIRTKPTRLERLDSWLGSLESGTFVLGVSFGRNEPEWPARLVRVASEAGYPDTLRLLELTREGLARGERLDPWFLEPSYVRRSAAEEKAV